MKSGGGKHRFQGSIDSRKERDEDLLLFRDLYRREEQRNVSLLQSDDFEATLGSNQLYRMPSAKRGGYDPFNSDGEKSDYDWLKTPPMTPLFPSIEMEPFDQKILQYKEPSNMQPVRTSRFGSAYREDLKPIQVQRPRSPSARSTTSTSSSSPGRRPGSSSGNSAASVRTTAVNLQPKPNQSTKRTFAPSRPSSSSSNSTTSTKSGTTATAASAASKPWSHVASPRSRTLASLPDFTDEAPPNLITSAAPAAVPGRAASVTRGRPGTTEVKLETTASSKPRRQSLSPNAVRGRRAPEFGHGQPPPAGCGGGGGNLLVGSRMVEKMMNARKSAGSKEDMLDTKPKHRAPPPAANDLAQYGRLMTRSSLDLAFKHMELRKGSSDNNQQKVSSAATRNPVVTDQKVLTTPSDGGRAGGRRSADSKLIVKRNNIDGRHRFGLC